MRLEPTRKSTRAAQKQMLSRAFPMRTQSDTSRPGSVPVPLLLKYQFAPRLFQYQLLRAEQEAQGRRPPWGRGSSGNLGGRAGAQELG